MFLNFAPKIYIIKSTILAIIKSKTENTKMWKEHTKVLYFLVKQSYKNNTRPLDFPRNFFYIFGFAWRNNKGLNPTLLFFFIYFLFVFFFSLSAYRNRGGGGWHLLSDSSGKNRAGWILGILPLLSPHHLPLTPKTTHLRFFFCLLN